MVAVVVVVLMMVVLAVMPSVVRSNQSLSFFLEPQAGCVTNPLVGGVALLHFVRVVVFLVLSLLLFSSLFFIW